jgi:hypothetical protein
LVQIRTMNYDGYLPWTVWVSPTEVGEKVRLFMRPGLSVRDLEDRIEAIAAACWAREARVSRSRKNAARVVVEIIRRDPLTADRVVANPLTRLTSTWRVPSDPAPPVTAVVPEPRVPADRHVPTLRPAKPPVGEPDPVVVIDSGDDMSDYL